MKRKFLILLFSLPLFMLMTNPIFAQGEPGTQLRKHSIQGSVGTLGVYFSAIGTYEYIFWQNKKTHLATFARAGYGGYAVLLATGGGVALFEGGILTGASKSHFEAAIGLSYFMPKDENEFTAPAASVGYRLQKPGGHFIFRTGLGYPEALYVGLGVAF